MPNSVEFYLAQITGALVLSAAQAAAQADALREQVAQLQAAARPARGEEPGAAAPV